MKRFIFFLISSLFSGVVATQPELGDFYFVLLMPNEVGHYACAIFTLEELKVCRFPHGPMTCNKVDRQQTFLIDQLTAENLRANATPLSILCLDGKTHHTCGFALPWGYAMAYVFENLEHVDRVLGMIIEKNCLSKFNLTLPEMFEPQMAYDSEDDNFDEINALLANETDTEFASRPLPYPLQQIKQFLGRIAIAGIMYYYEVKEWVVKTVGFKLK